MPWWSRSGARGAAVGRAPIACAALRSWDSAAAATMGPRGAAPLMVTGNACCGSGGGVAGGGGGCQKLWPKWLMSCRRRTRTHSRTRVRPRPTARRPRLLQPLQRAVPLSSSVCGPKRCGRPPPYGVPRRMGYHDGCTRWKSFTAARGYHARRPAAWRGRRTARRATGRDHNRRIRRTSPAAAAASRPAPPSRVRRTCCDAVQ